MRKAGNKSPKSTTKAAKTAVRSEIRSFFSPSTGKGGRSSLENMKKAADSYNADMLPKYHPSDYTKGAALVDGGWMASVPEEQSRLLSKIYGKENVKSWSADKIHNTYRHLVGREYDAMLREKECAQKKANRKVSGQKPSFDVKAMWRANAKPAAGTRDERIGQLTARGISRADAEKAIAAEDAFRSKQRRMQTAAPTRKMKAQNKETYTVCDTKRGKTFATSDEAIAYANERGQRTGEIFAVTQTRKAVTHTYAGRPQKKK